MLPLHICPEAEVCGRKLLAQSRDCARPRPYEKSKSQILGSSRTIPTAVIVDSRTLLLTRARCSSSIATSKGCFATLNLRQEMPCWQSLDGGLERLARIAGGFGHSLACAFVEDSAHQ